MSIVFFLLLHLSLSPVLSVSFASAARSLSPETNPFTPRAALIRYWNKKISNNLQIPSFFLSKASSLTSVNSAILSGLASERSLSSNFQFFCSSANLFCLFDGQPDSTNPHGKETSFAGYGNRNFANYGGSSLSGSDSFKNYSEGLNSPEHSFTHYSRNSHGHNEDFTNYGKDGNVATSNFVNYAAGASAGSGEFKNYADLVNVPKLLFASYDSSSIRHKLLFSSYSDDTNSGSESFISYGKKGNVVPNEFDNYATSSNIVTSTFNGYGESGSRGNDSFKSYGFSGNNPHTNFKSYSAVGNASIQSFTSYRNNANDGDDTFLSYGKNSTSGRVNFANYGRSFNHGNDSFKEYGNGSNNRVSVGFESYSKDRSFKDYSKKNIQFSEYSNSSTALGSSSSSSGSSVKRWVEPGKFFRESMLKQGNVMVMPDIRDKMPKRPFLPRNIVSKLPFSTKRIDDVKKIFHAGHGSTAERMILDALRECEREASKGETKRCVGSAEDIIDFSTAVLGGDVTVRTTMNVRGSKERVMIGAVDGINGGRVTESVSCHQSMYPYLLYYCHSVPKVRVYEADILDEEGRGVINRGVAICHLDTSSWGPEHGAFVALGSTPGEIEVCHWIFENDLTWTVADGLIG